MIDIQSGGWEASKDSLSLMVAGSRKDKSELEGNPEEKIVHIPGLSEGVGSGGHEVKGGGKAEEAESDT